jgi:MFS family permease
MGWLGSTYFLAFGMTYPVIGRLFILSPNIGVMFLLRLTFIVVFAIGTLCSYSVLSVQGIAVGRALCGLGAAGLVPDPGTIREVRGISFLVYSIGTFIGPMWVSSPV